jgi:hypothetical protein
MSSFLSQKGNCSKNHFSFVVFSTIVSNAQHVAEFLSGLRRGNNIVTSFIVKCSFLRSSLLQMAIISYKLRFKNFRESDLK